MIKFVLFSVSLGGLIGYFCLNYTYTEAIDTTMMYALNCMIFLAGIEIGSNKHVLRQLCNAKSLLLAFAIPTSITLGTLVVGTLFGMMVGLPFYDSLLVSSGLGWYSLVSVVISTQYSPEIGTIAGLANMSRELIGFIVIPLLAKYNKFLALAPSGAATMDSSLPIILKYTNIRVGIYSFINGLVLTILVPIFLSILLP